MLDRILIKAFGPILDRIPKGWKTMTGLLVYAAIQLAALMAWIDAETAEQAEAVAVVLFGFGVWHATKGASK